jgi:hypothetical protein
MAKKQTRRSVSLNRDTYERLKAYCDINGLAMSQFVETRIGDFLGAKPKKGATEVAAKKAADRIFTF